MDRRLEALNKHVFAFEAALFLPPCGGDLGGPCNRYQRQGDQEALLNGMLREEAVHMLDTSKLADFFKSASLDVGR